MKTASAKDLHEFLGEKTVASAASAPSGEDAAQPAQEPTNIGTALDSVNTNLQGGNQTLTQLNELIGNVAKITDNIGAYLGGKSSQRKSDYNSDSDQQLDAFGQPMPRSVSEQSKSDYEKFARRRADEKREAKPPEKLPTKRKASEGGGASDPKAKPAEAGGTESSDERSQMPDDEKARLTYAFFGEVLRGIAQTKADATIAEIREEYKNGQEQIIEQLEKQIISL